MKINGKRYGVFHEDGMSCVVEVVFDSSTELWEELTLRVVKVISRSSIFVSPEEGKKFTVGGTKREGTAYKGWHLFEEGERVERALRECGVLNG